VRRDPIDERDVHDVLPMDANEVTTSNAIMKDPKWQRDEIPSTRCQNGRVIAVRFEAHDFVDRNWNELRPVADKETAKRLTVVGH